ncbi:hypothetical protein Ancab_039454 [Ancistrocladus abbreviatus]
MTDQADPEFCTKLEGRNVSAPTLGKWLPEGSFILRKFPSGQSKADKETRSHLIRVRAFSDLPHINATGKANTEAVVIACMSFSITSRTSNTDNRED